MRGALADNKVIFPHLLCYPQCDLATPAAAISGRAFPVAYSPINRIDSALGS